MAKSKGKSSRKKGGQVEEVVQCPHLHFKTDVIDRNVLSKEQHLNLLSTPKGYRWEEYKKEGGDGGPVEELSPSRRILCSGRRMKKAEKVYVHNFLAEVWNLLTPEMVDRLKGMLMNEFGMSPQEADDFICKQREENIVNSSTVSFYKKPRDIGDGKYVYDHVVKMRNPNKAHCDKITKSNLGIRNSWIKDFSDSLSEMMSSYVLDTMCAERTDRQQEIAQTLLNRFNALLEQNASMSDPKTPTDKTLVLVADRLATWLDNNVGVSKEAAQQIKIMGEAERRKNMEEDRKRRLEQMKKERERREAEEEAQRLADEQARKLTDEQARKLADEQTQKLSGDDKKKSDEEQAQNLAEEEKTQRLAEEEEEEEEEEEKEKSPGGPEEPTTETIQGETAGEQTAEQKEEGEAQNAEEEQPRTEPEEATPDATEIKEQDEQKETDEKAAAVAAEQQKALDELEQKEEDEKAEVAAAAAAEAEKLKAEEEQKKAEEEASAKAEQQRVEEEQKKADQEATEAEKQRAEEEEKNKAEQEVAEKQKAEEERLKAEKEAAKVAEIEKQKAEDEQKKKLEEEVEVESKKGSEEPVDEKPVAEPAEQPLAPSDVPVEDTPPSETTESEPPISDAEDETVPVLRAEKGDEVEPAREEVKPVDKVAPEVAGRVESGLSPEEKEKRTNEVLKSVASIILETKVDSSPRQGALKDIMEKQLEENLGDQDKEAIGKVSSKIGTWIDKIVDQATLEYGEREPSRPPPGPDDIWATASSRAQPPISGPSGMKVPAESGLVTGVSRTPTEPGWVPGVSGAPTQPGLVPGVAEAPTQPGWVSGVTGTPTQPGWIPGVTGASSQPGWVPGVSTALGQPGRVPGFGRTPEEPGWLPGFGGVKETVSPGTRVPVAQRPKGRIYHLSRTDSGFDVNVISNTRAQEKIRIARGKSPAYGNVPNPDAPMEPSDLKKWYNWTSALGEVAESWAEWIKDTIKGTQQRGEELVRDNSPQRLSEWREFRDNRAQSARKWQQTKIDMEQRAEMWSQKRRRVQSQ